MGKHESSIPEQVDSRFRGVDKTGMARVLGIIPCQIRSQILFDASLFVSITRWVNPS